MNVIGTGSNIVGLGLDNNDDSITTEQQFQRAVNNTEKLMSGATLVEELFDNTITTTTAPQEQQQEPTTPVDADGNIVSNNNTPMEVTNDTDDYYDDYNENYFIDQEGGRRSGDGGETLPLTTHDYTSKSYQQQQSTTTTEYATLTSSSSSQPYQDPTKSPKTRAKILRAKSGMKKKQSWWNRMKWICCHPLPMLRGTVMYLWNHSLFVKVAMPFFVMAYIFYIPLRNPQWTFLPGHASVAWWLNFMGRQTIVLELARIIQWFFIDKLVLGTRIAVQCLGPLLTLCFIQARGWPFSVAVWGFLDLLLLEGKGEFQQHWFYFLPSFGGNSTPGTNGGDSSGSYILASESYVRLLLSMMLAGFACAIKRTAVAMYFGRRTFVQFKPRLEKLLKEVVLVSEVAALADEAEIVATEDMIMLEMSTKTPKSDSFIHPLKNRNHGPRNSHHHPHRSLVDSANSKVKFIGDVTWSKGKRTRSFTKLEGGEIESDQILIVQESEDVSESDDDDDDDDDNISNDDNSSNNDSDDDDDEDDDDEDDKDGGGSTGGEKGMGPDSTRYSNSQGSRKMLINLLEHWDEPINKADKSLNASISDILRFRRALTFMDDDFLFGEAFGPASTREQVVTSSATVYRRLLKLTPGKLKVSCDFYDMLALEDDGETVNSKKLKALRRLFRPDASNEISMVAFVQSCDSMYKKLRYFRANVGNASVIDHALESIVDGAFSFALGLVLLSVMRINPMALLVSLSTLLVSISFAVGSSASKWFEGMLLVAARRPFDLGDRIYMTDPSVVNSDGLWYCWFVEDINLFHTTVRYAGTNEIATINNGSVANMRIMNGARSPDAMVWFQFPYRANLMEDDNINKVKQALDKYARDNPRNWHSFSYFRVDEVHPDIEKFVVTIGMQHRSSWQDLPTILEAKAQCMCWLLEYGRQLGINYDQLPKRDLLYFAGSLKEGGVNKHRYQLHDPSNITSGGSILPPISTGGTALASSSSPFSYTKSQDDSIYEKRLDDNLSENARFLEQLKHSQGQR